MNPLQKYQNRLLIVYRNSLNAIERNNLVKFKQAMALINLIEEKISIYIKHN